VVAACCEVEVDRASGAPRLIEVVQAFECGAILNPANLRSQVEGCIMMGVGPALREEILFKDGKLTNARFATYRVPRFRDVPKLDVILLDRKDLESAGAGETPIIAIAPAIANAVFDATGKRVHSMPIRSPRS
jgi:isoquinoline 1-oxidoreductase